MALFHNAVPFVAHCFILRVKKKKKIHDDLEHMLQSQVHISFVSNVQFVLYHYSQIQHAPPSGKLHSQPPNPSRGECYSTLADQIKHLTEIAERERQCAHVS